MEDNNGIPYYIHIQYDSWGNPSVVRFLDLLTLIRISIGYTRTTL
nr:MAG TPA: hypothetical protein [Caudoviricetes sp.]